MRDSDHFVGLMDEDERDPLGHVQRRLLALQQMRELLRQHVEGTAAAGRVLKKEEDDPH